MSSIPTFVGAGTLTGGTGSISPPVPAGRQADDLLVLLVESANQGTTLATSGWTLFTATPQGSGTAGATTASRITAFWKISTGSESSVTVNTGGDHHIGVVLAFRGVDTTSPINDQAGSGASASTSFSCPTITTTVNNCLVVAVVTNQTDTTTAQTSGWTNAGLSSLTEIFDGNSNAGNGGGIGVAAGGKATAGATGATTGTLATSSTQGRLQFAITPQTAFTLTADRGTFSLGGKPAMLSKTGDPVPVVIESFEGSDTTAPYQGDLLWNQVTGASAITQTISNVTYGNVAWLMQGLVTVSQGLGILSESVDISTLESVALDVRTNNFHASGQATLALYDTATGDTYYDTNSQTAAGFNGVATLQIALADVLVAYPSWDLTNTQFMILVSATSGAQIHQLVMDFLRGYEPSSGSYTLTADSGAFSLTGQAATLKRGLKLISASGSYALSGQAATLRRGLKLIAATGTYAFTGQAATLIYTPVAAGYTLIAEAGSHAVTGVDAILRAARKLNAGHGTYSITGIAAALSFVRKITASAGSFTVTGVAAAITVTRRLVATVGSCSLTGQAATLRYERKLIAGAGSYTLTGINASLLLVKRLVAAVGSFTVSGQSAILRRGLKLVTQTGSYALTGVSALLLRERKLVAAKGTYTLSGKTANLVKSNVGTIKVWNGSSWALKPLKVWNGTSWVAKPLKRWNGTSWI